MNEFLSQAFLLVIVVMSALIAHEFYIAKDGQLRLLIIGLFLSKIWVYGGAFVYFMLIDLKFITPVDPLLFRLILNFPMVVVMIKLWIYIRLHNK